MPWWSSRRGACRGEAVGIQIPNPNDVFVVARCTNYVFCIGGSCAKKRRLDGRVLGARHDTTSGMAISRGMWCDGRSRRAEPHFGAWEKGVMRWLCRVTLSRFQVAVAKGVDNVVDSNAQQNR